MAVLPAGDDPRVSPRFCRRCSGSAGDCLLLGVVHDHPASIGRIERVLAHCEPDVLALELPSLAIPLYRWYARRGPVDGRLPGGEMTAGIRAAPEADVVGIDAPNGAFIRGLASKLVADRAGVGTIRDVLASVGVGTREALACRIAATTNRLRLTDVICDEPIDYGCTRDDPPADQAAHERAHLGALEALLGATDGTGTVVDYRDAVREECMIERLASLRSRGDVVAVVGVDHLEALAAGLATRSAA